MLIVDDDKTVTWNLQIWVSRGKESKSMGQMKVMWVAWLERESEMVFISEGV